MQIEERVVNNVTILDLKGKITLGEGDEALKDKINSLIQQDKKKLLLNLGIAVWEIFHFKQTVTALQKQTAPASNNDAAQSSHTD